MCSPHLLVAIQKNDAEALAQYTAIFTRIGVADTIAQLYFSSLTDWLSEASASCNPAQLSEWLASFLVTVSDKITAECNTLPERFPSISQSDLGTKRYGNRYASSLTRRTCPQFYTFSKRFAVN